MSIPNHNLGRDSGAWGNIIERKVTELETAVGRLGDSSIGQSIAQLTKYVTGKLGALPALVLSTIASATINTSQLSGTIDQGSITGTWDKAVNGPTVTATTVTGTAVNATNSTIGALDVTTITSLAIYANSLVGTLRDLQISSLGVVGYLPSSARFKSDIEPLNLADPKAILALELVTYWYTADPEKRPDVGVIAETVNDLGYWWLVDYDEDGVTPFGFKYARLALAYLPYLQDVEKRLAKLESRADEGSVL